MSQPEVNASKRILVTGGAGFLGSHLIDRLLARGDSVICVDNLYTGTEDNIRHHSALKALCSKMDFSRSTELNSQ